MTVFKYAIFWDEVLKAFANENEYHQQQKFYDILNMSQPAIANASM